jgi:hypothetical protein
VRNGTSNKLAQALSLALYCAAVATAILIQPPGSGLAWLIMVFGGRSLAVAVHELGQVACCLALGTEIDTVSMGILPLPIRFRLGKVRVDLSYLAPEFVQYRGASVQRSLVITASAPTANLLASGVLLAAGVSLGSPAGRPIWYGLALISAGHAIVSLIPRRTWEGRISAGAKLFFAPVYRRTGRELRALASDPGWVYRQGNIGAILLAAYRLRMPLAARSDSVATLARLIQREGRRGDLLKLHRAVGMLWAEEGDQRDVALAVNAVESCVLVLPGLPKTVADEAAAQMKRVLRHVEKDDEYRADAEHTLALAYLRQGRLADVEKFCQSGLEDVESPKGKATILATIVLARRGLGEPYADLLDKARKLAPDADLVAEASAFDPLPR